MIRFEWKSRTSLWTLLGPALIGTTLAIQMGVSVWFPIVFLLSFVAIWKAKLWGSAFAMGITALVLPMGIGTWTLLFSYLVTALCLFEGERVSCAKEEALEGQLGEKEEERRASEALYLQEKIEHENAMEERNLEIKALLEEVSAFKRLADASQAEAEKYYAQNQHLLETALASERQGKEMALLREELEEVKALRAQVNHYRTLNYEKDLLVEHYQSLDGGAEEVPVPVQEAHDRLRTLQNDRLEAKGTYEELLADYRRVLAQLEEGRGVVENLTQKREELAATRERIFRLEGEMLKTQQTLGQKAAEEGYLAIADGECHRLEEENAMLLDLLRKQQPN